MTRRLWWLPARQPRLARDAGVAGWMGVLPASLRSVDGPAAVRVLGILLLMPAIAGLGVTAVQLYLGQGLHLLSATMVATLALTSYALNKLTDGEEDRRNDPRGTRAREGGGIVLLAVASAALVATAVALSTEGRLHPIYGLILLVGVLYSCPLLPWYRRGRGPTLVRLKAIPGIKNLAITATWTTSVFLVPLLDGSPARIAPRFVLLAAGYGLMIWLASFFSDLRDADGDQAAGVVTLATLLGPARAQRWVTLMTVAWAACLAAIYAASNCLDTPHFVFLLAAGVGYPALVGVARHRLRFSPGRLDLVVESADLFYATGLLTLARLT